MCIAIPESIKTFSELHFKKFGKLRPNLMARYITGMLLTTGKRSLSALGSTVLTMLTCKTVESKAFRRPTFNLRAFHRAMTTAMLNTHRQLFGTEGDWVLLIDGVSSKRGSKTQIENFIQYREKSSGSKGRSTKACTFIQGLLISPFGVRLSTTRYSYYTKEYCKTYKVRYRTMHEIAAALIREIRAMVPAPTSLFVVADCFFDSKIMFRTCRESDAVFITIAKSSRTYIEGRKRKKLHKKGKYGLNTNDYKNFSIVKGREKWTHAHQRSSTDGLKNIIEHLYRIASATLNVSGLGPTGVVFSWKRDGKNKNTFRVLLCSDPSIDPCKIVEMYALRWQIEIFFRELKSYLGFEDFMGRSFKAFERFIDLCLISFSFLEHYRITLLEKARSGKESERISIMRTSGLIAHLRNESMESLRDYVIVKKGTGREEKLVA